MRHKRVRAKITETLKQKGEAMTAEEIYHAIKVRRISNGKAISNIIKGINFEVIIVATIPIVYVPDISRIRILIIH